MFRLTWSDLQNSSDAPASSDPTVSPDSLDSPDSKLVQMSNKARNIWIEASFSFVNVQFCSSRWEDEDQNPDTEPYIINARLYITEATNINMMNIGDGSSLKTKVLKFKL